MKDTLGLILTGRSDAKPNELTQFRTAAALPVAGRYRLIDFTLSSFVNSGIVNVGIAAGSKFSSLITHIGTGAEWDLNRRAQGLKIIYPDAGKEDAKALPEIMDFLKNSRQKYVLAGYGDILLNADFRQFLRFHKEKRSDISIMYKKSSEQEELSNSDILEFDTTDRLYALERSPRIPLSKNVSLNVYLMERRLLMKLIEDSCTGRDFLTDYVVRNLNELRIFGYRFAGYAKRVYGIHSYYTANMDIFKNKVRSELFDSDSKIYTGSGNFAPTQYGDNAEVSDSFIADGCRIDGEVSESILFGGVRIEKGAKIKNCILMDKSFIGNESSLEYVVLDKDCVIREGARLCGQESFPVIIGKGAVI